MNLLIQAAKNIVPYLNWTISDESPGHHPTLPSAIAAFENALKKVEAAEYGWTGYYAGPGDYFWMPNKPQDHELVDYQPATLLEKAFFAKFGRIGDGNSRWIREDEALSVVIKHHLGEREKKR